MVRKVAAAALLSLGTGVQFGVGWALLTAGVLLAVGLPSEADLHRAATAARVTMVGWWQAAAGMPRRVLAAGGMAGGLALVPAGIILTVGVGAGLVSLGGLLLAASLLWGWNA